MEEEPGDRSVPSSSSAHRRLTFDPIPSWSHSGRLKTWLILLLIPALTWTIVPPVQGDALSTIRASGTLRWGADKEGGAPFVFGTSEDADELIGFEVELAQRIARGLGVKAEFIQGQWDRLLADLDRQSVDLVLNGYEWTPLRAQRYLATRPYYAYQFQLLTRRDGTAHCWADLRMPRDNGRPWRVGVLVGSAAKAVAENLGGPSVRVVEYDTATGAMLDTVNGRNDATLQDLAPALYYLKQPDYADLAFAGPPEALGYYVMFLRPEDVTLRDEVNRVLDQLIDSGELRAIYEKYGIWNEAQSVLAQWNRQETTVRTVRGGGFNARLLERFGTNLLSAAGMTVFLSVCSFPLAMLIGLLVALGRLYGPWPMAQALGLYVEVIRGTPLMLQLFVIYYLFPKLGIYLAPELAGITGLAINYSAYEAEIYRAGFQAIPIGQMEAAQSLGMSQALALRRVIVPQAARIVIPPVTNDFIALFKDTSVCSVITLTELTKEYSILANTYGGVIEFGLAAAVLYMAMSLPLSWFSKWFEARLDAEKSAGGAA
jgi:polar amino acid transport system substrate-binding protein